MSHLWMVAYDISDDKIRRSIHRQLSDHGQRVQYSVFECRLSKQQFNVLQQSISQCIETGDSVRWYPLCDWCETAVDWQGSGKTIDTDEFYLL